MSIDPSHIQVATARWNIPVDPAVRADPANKRAGALVTYARHVVASEINSSFYRHHGATTYARWARVVPDGFRFSAKIPRSVTHDARLVGDGAVQELERFLDDMRVLGARCGPLLLQLPPSLAFDAAVVDEFLGALRERWSGPVVCEPRHGTWFDTAADGLLTAHRVGRVAADPAVVPEAAAPGGWDGIVYVRLHGSPRMYHSSYDDEYLEALAGRLRDLASGPAQEIWCSFDNTASGAAFDNAVALQRLLGVRVERPTEPPAGPRFVIRSDTR